MTQRTPYCPPDMAEWRETWDMLCRHCAHWTDCDTVEAMIAHTEGAPWPEGGWTTDPGGGVTCLGYRPRATQPKLSRQQIRRLARMNPATLPPVCGGRAATKGTEASNPIRNRGLSMA